MDKIDVDLVTVMTLRYSTFYFLWSLLQNGFMQSGT